MKTEVVAFIAVACGLFLYSITRSRKTEEVKEEEHEEEKVEEKIEDNDVKFYTKQKVSFVKDGSSYIETMKEELEQNNPHFNYLRKLA